ncbi:MAG: hypothetical protein KDD82_02215, partial [Planctomycetes bacterium]|nr:hypothetical protein [Planctomycetota bacterium]
MSDRALRELERRYLAAGDAEARELLIRARLRVGEVPEARLRLAQHLGDPLALQLLGPPPEPPPLTWLRRAARAVTDRFDHPGVSAEALELGRWTSALLREFEATASAEACRCALGAARASWLALDEGWDALRAAEAAPTPEHAAERAAECARVAAQAVGAGPVHDALVAGLTDWALALPPRHPPPPPLLHRAAG